MVSCLVHLMALRRCVVGARKLRGIVFIGAWMIIRDSGIQGKCFGLGNTGRRAGITACMYPLECKADRSGDIANSDVQDSEIVYAVTAANIINKALSRHNTPFP